MEFLSSQEQSPGMALHWAIDIAENAHYGQLSASGEEPYLRHPLRVMAALEPYGAEAQVVGVLHDVVEHSPEGSGTTYTLDNLSGQGLSGHCREAVDALTKRPGEPYEETIARSKQSTLSTLVRIADNRDHANPAVLARLPVEDREQATRKYASALEQLIDGDSWLAEQAGHIEERIGNIYAEEQARLSQESPAARLNFSVDPEYAKAKISKMKQSQLIHNFYRATKGYDLTNDGSVPIMHSVDKAFNAVYYPHDPYRINRGAEAEPWDDDTLDRIIVRKSPRNLAEEELMHMEQLRGSMTALSWHILNSSDTPDNVKSKFVASNYGRGIFADSLHMTDQELSKAHQTLLKWELDHPDEDTPLDFDKIGNAKIEGVCQRTNELIAFYNEHSEELLNPSRDQTNIGINARARGQFIASLLRLLAPEKAAADMRQLCQSVLH